MATSFFTNENLRIPALTTEQMREVDRIAVEEFDLGILQMMENAGRNLAQLALTYLEHDPGRVTILAGPGGNGGGGICCARHLHNRGVDISLGLSKSVESLGGAARNQFAIVEKSGIQPLAEDEIESAISQSALVIDALIGYSLLGAPRGRAAELIDLCNRAARYVISLDVPSGLDSTTGDTPGLAVRANATLTLALPKTGLAHFEGDLYLADIGIPPEIYEKLGVEVEPYFKNEYWIPIHSK